MEKILIDSDICLDVFTFRLPYAVDSARLIEAVEQKKMAGVVSAESFTNIFYVLRKYGSAEMAKKRIADLRLLVGVGKITAQTIDRAIESEWRDFEDAVQYFCALEHQCDVIVTRNTTDYKPSDIPVFTPHQFLEKKKII